MATSFVTEERDQSVTLEDPINLRCRKCRRCLLDSTSILKVGTSSEAAATCNVWHLNVESLPDWILASVGQATWTMGKLNCQNCGARLGGFNFVNCSKCSCGRDTTVHLSKSRVDQDLKPKVLLARPGRTREHIMRRKNEVECLAQTISSSPSSSSTVSHVASEVESTEEPQILETFERGTYVSLPSELLPQLSDYQESLEVQHLGSASQSRTSLDRALNPEEVRLGVMEEPSRNISPNLEPKLSKREKNHMKSLRRKQRKKERWVQRQQEAKDLATKWDLTGSDDDEREGYTCAVCLDIYYSPYKCHPCSHVFCEPCLRTLAKNRPSNTPCPLCRTLISHVLFQEELNQTTKTCFPKVYCSRHETFQKTNYSKWPLPNCPKRFRVFWGFQRHGGPASRWQFPHRAFGLDALDLGDMWGWPFDIDFVIISVYSLHWVMAFIIFCGLCYFLLL
ncbi:E3 ubiquitin-protein ligase RNF180 isoform X2 [Puntigrus tetrazona]|uniref:E3 ubiquitin-protein ligase RNF180 isoform X2 n=1 Tax=Puntigrus tetrazona TaxID=1606681 RepID=UPI001C8900B4|nr:E3 ubiquitin-protein ligase RNF180 isoform X2 [Puntigrus tetrazona]